MKKEEMKKKAKMMALTDMKAKMKGMLSEGYGEKMPMKVSVASDSKEGLEKGMSMAQKIMKDKMGDDMSPKSKKESEDMDCKKKMKK